MNYYSWITGKEEFSFADIRDLKEQSVWENMSSVMQMFSLRSILEIVVEMLYRHLHMSNWNSGQKIWAGVTTSGVISTDYLKPWDFMRWPKNFGQKPHCRSEISEEANEED